MWKKEKTRTFAYLKGVQTLERVAKKGCGVSILEDVQNRARHVPGKPALVHPALSTGFGSHNLQRSFPHSNIP